MKAVAHRRRLTFALVVAVAFVFAFVLLGRQSATSSADVEPTGVPIPRARPTPPATPYTPAPTQNPTPTPPALRSHAGTYEAIAIRPTTHPDGADVIAVAVDGQERLIRHLDAKVFSFGLVSDDGWIAVVSSEPGSWTIADLADPAAPIRTVWRNKVNGTGGWGPGGLFATTLPGGSCCAIQVMNGHDGSTRVIPGVGIRDLVDRCCRGITWAADGSGLRVHTPTGAAVVHLDGTRTPGGLPVTRRPGPRYTLPDGTDLVYCHGSDRDCPVKGLAGRQVVTKAPDGTITSWYDGRKGTAQVGDVSFSSSGDAIWLLLDRVAGGNHTAELARLDAPGAAITVMASIDLGKGVSHVGFSASSEDDSVFVIAADLGPAGEPTGTIYMMIDTEGHATRLAGYDYMAQLVPAALADTLPGDDFGPRPVPSAAP